MLQRAYMGNRTPAAPAGDPFFQRMVTTVAVLVVTALLVTLAVLGIGILLAAFAGVLVAVVLNAAARQLAKRSPLAYIWALAVVVVLVVAVLAGAGWLLGGQIAAEADEFARMLPVVIADTEAWLRQHGWGQWLLEQVEDGAAGGGEAGEGGVAVGTAALSVLGVLSSAFTYLLVAVFVGLFGAANPRLYVDGMIGLAPPRHRDGMAELLAALGHTLRRWLIGQGFAMVIIGVSTTIVLWLFGIPLAIVVGLIVALLAFIPYIGPIIGVVPVAVVAGPAGAATLLWVLVTYTAVQMVEGYVIQPLIFERTVYLPPVFTIIAQMLLGAVLGIKGIVLATPLAAVTLVLSRAYQRNVLGDTTVELQPSREES